MENDTTQDVLISRPAPVDSDDESLERVVDEMNDANTSATKSKDDRKKGDIVETSQQTLNKLQAPQNLRLLRRDKSQIQIEWDISNSISQSDKNRWCYSVTYKELNDEKENKNDNNQHPRKLVVTTVKNGQTKCKFTEMSPNAKYWFSVSISDTAKQYHPSDYCQTLIVGKYGMYKNYGRFFVVFLLFLNESLHMQVFFVFLCFLENFCVVAVS